MNIKAVQDISCSENRLKINVVVRVICLEVFKIVFVPSQAILDSVCVISVRHMLGKVK